MQDNLNGEVGEVGPQLLKWIESTANFIPNKNNYVEWPDSKRAASVRKEAAHFYPQKEELDAAEALARLACNSRISSIEN